MIKIVIEIKGNNVELTVDEAMKLKSELEQMFNGKTEYIPYNPVVYPYPCQPYNPWTVTYWSSAGDLVSFGG